MTNESILVAMFIVVILIVIYTMMNLHTSVYENYMSGFWIAEKGSTFCEESDIDSMMLYVGPEENGWFGHVQRQCYIIIMPGVAESFTMSYTRSRCGPTIGKYKINCEIEFDHDQLWDENVVMEFDITDGIICIYTLNDDTKLVCAQLVKSHETTNLVKELESLEME